MKGRTSRSALHRFTPRDPVPNQQPELHSQLPSIGAEGVDLVENSASSQRMSHVDRRDGFVSTRHPAIGALPRKHLTQGEIPVEERRKSVEHGLLLDSVAVVCREARGRRENPRHCRARRQDRTVTERSLDERPRRFGVEPFVGDEVLELLVAPGVDVAPPLLLDVRVDGDRVDERENQVALVTQRRCSSRWRAGSSPVSRPRGRCRRCAPRDTARRASGCSRR